MKWDDVTSPTLRPGVELSLLHHTTLWVSRTSAVFWRCLKNTGPLNRGISMQEALDGHSQASGPGLLFCCWTDHSALCMLCGESVCCPCLNNEGWFEVLTSSPHHPPLQLHALHTVRAWRLSQCCLGVLSVVRAPWLSPRSLFTSFSSTPSPVLLLLSHFSRVQLRATPETAAHQALLSLGFCRQEHRSGLPFPSPMHESEKWKWSCSVVSDS